MLLVEDWPNYLGMTRFLAPIEQPALALED